MTKTPELLKGGIPYMAFFQELDTIWLVKFLKRLPLSYDYQLHSFYNDPYYNAKANLALSRFVKALKEIETLHSLEEDGMRLGHIADERLDWYKYYMKFAKIHKDKYIKLLGSN